MSLDCEMDQDNTGLSADQLKEISPHSSKNPGLVLKVSMVNEKGEIVLDTLVDYTSYQIYKKDIPSHLKV